MYLNVHIKSNLYLIITNELLTKGFLNIIFNINPKGLLKDKCIYLNT